MQLNYILGKYAGGYKFIKSQKMNHFMYIDNFKIFTKNEKNGDPNINNKNI